MTLAFGGLLLVATFMTLVMTKRDCGRRPRPLVPIVFALLFGFGGDLPKCIADGITRVAPTGIMLMFAILYFGIMIDAGLFRPLVNRIIGWAGDDPLRVTLGHTLLVTIVSLDGDGTTTLMVTASALLPAYRRLGISPLVFGVLGAGCTTLMNMSPWGGQRRALLRHCMSIRWTYFSQCFRRSPSGLPTFGFAWHFGVRERARISKHGLPTLTLTPLKNWRLPARNRPCGAAATADLVQHSAHGRPHDLRCSAGRPLLVLFLLGVVIALLVNYPRMADQRTRLLAHSGNVLSVVLMVLAAGAFTGVARERAVNAMSEAITTVLPKWRNALGP